MPLAVQKGVAQPCHVAPVMFQEMTVSIATRCLPACSRPQVCQRQCLPPSGHGRPPGITTEMELQSVHT